MPDIKQWLEKVNKIQVGDPSKPKVGQPIPTFADTSIGVTPNVSSVNLKQYSDYVGNVKLSGSESDYAMLDELRAQNQSALEQAGNSIGKFGIYAGTTFIDGLAGTATGLVNMVTGGEDSKFQWSDFWNNPLSNAMTDIQDWSEKVLPNYKTAAEIDAPFWKSALGMSDGFVNFWGDTVFKNLGFTVGALGAAALSGGVAGEGLLLKQVSKSLAKNYYGKLARTLGKSSEEISAMVRAGDIGIEGLTGQLAKNARNLKVLNGVQQVEGAMLSAMAEARFEAINGAKDYYNTKMNTLLEQGMSKEEADKIASKESLGVGNAIFGMNTALLSLSNAAQFKSLLNPGYKAQSKAIQGLIKKEGKYALEDLSKLQKAGKLFVNPFIEGGEEMAQYAIEKGSQSYFERINDPETTNVLNAFVGASVDGLSKAFSEEGFESFFVGFFTGGVGMPNVAEAIRAGDAKKALSAWSGGIAEQYRSIQAEQARGTENVEKLNKILESKEFQNTYSNVAAAMTAEKAKQAALAKGDEIAYELANNKQFHAVVQNHLDAGKIDDLYDVLNEQERKDADTLRSEWTVKNEKGEQIDTFKNLSNDELVAYNKENIKQQKEIIKKVAEFTDQIETVNRGQISEPIKKTLVEALTTTYFSEKKGEELRKEIVDKVVSWKAKNKIDTPTELDFFPESSSKKLREAKGTKLEKVSNNFEAIYNDLVDYVKATKDTGVYKQLRDWASYQKARQEAVDLYAHISKDPVVYEKKALRDFENKLNEQLQNEIEPGEQKPFRTTADVLKEIKDLGYNTAGNTVNEAVPLEFFDSDGKSLGKGVIVKDNNNVNIVQIEGNNSVKFEALTKHKGTIRFAPREENLQLDEILSSEDVAEKSFVAEEQPESYESKPDYQKESVAANTYLHIDYDNTGGKYFDVQKSFTFKGKTYTMPSFVTNAWQKAYGDWMSQVTDYSNYELELVTPETKNQTQLEAIRGFNPNGVGTDQVYIFVVDKRDGSFVKHDGVMLVSTVLDSFYNSGEGKRFTIEAAVDFLNNNGAKISYQAKSDKSFWFKIDGKIEEFKIKDFPSKESAYQTFENAFYRKMDEMYKQVKSDLYKDLVNKPQIRKITSISNGFEVRTEEFAEFSPTDVFTKEDLKNADVRLSTGKGADQRFPSSLPILTIKGGREIGMNVRNLNESEADFLIELFKVYGPQAVLGKASGEKTAKIPKVNNTDIFPPTFKKFQNKPVYSVLTNYINFGTERERLTGKINRTKDQIFIAKNKLVIITKRDLTTGEVTDSFKSYDFKLDEIEQNKELIKKYLLTKRRNISKNRLGIANAPAFKYSFVDGKLVETKVGTDYKSYLINDVLTTNLIPHTEGAQFAQRYFGFEWKSGRPLSVNIEEPVGKADSWDEIETVVEEFKPESTIVENKKAEPIVRAKLFDTTKKELVKGSVVLYNGKKYLFWNLTSSGKAQLINTDGNKYSGTPGVDKLVVLGTYPTIEYNNTEYIVTDNNNVYSGATGKLVYTGNDNSSKVQKERIIEKALNKTDSWDTLETVVEEFKPEPAITESKESEIERGKKEELNNVQKQRQRKSKKTLNKNKATELIKKLNGIINDDSKVNEFEKIEEELDDLLKLTGYKTRTKGEKGNLELELIENNYNSYGSNIFEGASYEVIDFAIRKVGDKIRVNTGSGVFNSTVTKIDSEGRVVEAKDDNGNIVIYNGAVLNLTQLEQIQKINAKYDAEYIDKVKKGEFTKQEAKEALKEIGRLTPELEKQIDDAELTALKKTVITQEAIVEDTPIDTSEDFTPLNFNNVKIYNNTKEEGNESLKQLWNVLSQLEVGQVIQGDGEITVVTDKTKNSVTLNTFERNSDGSLTQISNPRIITNIDGKIKSVYNPHTVGTNAAGERVVFTDTITNEIIDLSKEKILVYDSKTDSDVESQAFKKFIPSKIKLKTRLLQAATVEDTPIDVVESGASLSDFGLEEDAYLSQLQEELNQKEAKPKRLEDLDLRKRDPLKTLNELLQNDIIKKECN